MESKIKERLGQLFDEKKIECAVVFEKGTVPTKNAPILFIQKNN